MPFDPDKFKSRGFRDERRSALWLALGTLECIAIIVCFGLAMAFFAWALNQYDERREMVTVNYTDSPFVGSTPPADGFDVRFFNAPT